MQADAYQLAQSARRGDRAAAIQLIELFYGRIYAFLRRLAGNDSDAADLTQRSFTRVWQALPTFAARSSIGSWLHSIAYHTYVDWRRGNSHTEGRSEDWWAERICPGPRPDELAVKSDLATQLYASVDKLSPELRDTVHLHYYQELTLQETADAMGVSASTVKYRLRQALSELETKLDSVRAPAPSPAKSGIL